MIARQLVYSILCGAAASLYMFVATNRGIGISPDSVDYLSMASSFQRNGAFEVTGEDGFPELSIHRPVGYPASLAFLSSILSIDLRRAARLETVFFFGATTCLLGVWTATLVGGPIWLPAFAGAMFFLTPDSAGVHAMAWSEPGFLFFGFLGLFLVAVDSGEGRTTLLVAAGIALAIALLYRHAGAVFLVAACLSVLRSRTLHRRDRWSDAMGLGCIGGAPAALFYLRNKLYSGRATMATLHFFPLRRSDGGDLLRRLREMLSPDRRTLFAAGAALALLIVFAARSGTVVRPREGRGVPRRGSLPVVGLFVGLYLFFLAFSKLFLFVSIPLDARYLSPIVPAGVLLVCHAAAAAVAISRESAALNFGIAGLLMVFLLSRYSAAKRWLMESSLNPRQYADVRWTASESIGIAARLSRLLPAGTIFSNLPDLLELETGRRFASLPPRSDVFTGASNDRYFDEMRALGSNVRKGRAAVVDIAGLAGGTAAPADEVRQAVGEPRCREVSDGLICGGAQAPPKASR